MEQKGKLIVIDGTDGSGKETQSKLLVEHLRNEHHSVEMVDFPQYGHPSAIMVERYLRGEFGSAEEVGPFRASIFYALDRYAKSREMHAWLKEGRIIISNRYVSSNQGHQAGKLKEPEKIDSFLKWLDDLEYNIFGIPRPDKVILLHMPAHIGAHLVEKKGERKYIEGRKKDIHEADLNHLRDAEKAYLYVAKKEGWDVVECAQDDKPLPIPEIHKQVYALVKRIL